MSDPASPSAPLDMLRAQLAQQSFPAAALYVVATPIGNVTDISLRALHVLALVDAIAAEDTRNTRQLLNRYGIDKPLVAAHQHNERAAAETLIARLAKGERLALVSDAGTPGVSDPGARLVQSVRRAGYRVIPIAGPSSVTAAVSAAGMVGEGDAYYFVGFLPAKAGERQAALERLRSIPAALVILEAPHRVAQTVNALADLLGDRAEITFARELSKQFEEIASVPLVDAAAWLAADPHRAKGEYVLVLAAPPARAQEGALDVESERILATLLEELPLKQAVALAARLTSAPRNLLYERALSMKSERS